jgi:hypothetical protein
MPLVSGAVAFHPILSTVMRVDVIHAVRCPRRTRHRERNPARHIRVGEPAFPTMSLILAISCLVSQKKDLPTWSPATCTLRR